MSGVSLLKCYSWFHKKMEALKYSETSDLSDHGPVEERYGTVNF